MGLLRSEVVTIGDELLLGETVDTNAAWLGRRLAELGIPARGGATLADDADEIRRGVGYAIERAALVVVTGGLGPTRDDLTREAVARIVEDGDLLPNRYGTAPGHWLESAGGGVIVLLPGVPREMRGVFEESVAPRIRERFEGRLRPLRRRMIHTTGIPESVLSGIVEKTLAEAAEPVELAFLPRVAGVSLRLTAIRLDDPEEADAALDRVEGRLLPAIEPYRVSAESGEVVELIAALFTSRELTLATGESCTGGLIGKRLTDLPGASDFYLGGVVAYADHVKVDHLGVPQDLLARFGAVSEEVAVSMAEGAAHRFGSDVGVGITGIAGPGGGSSEKPVGTVWYAVAAAGRTEARSERFPGDRSEVRERSAQAALFLLLRRAEEWTRPGAPAP